MLRRRWQACPQDAVPDHLACDHVWLQDYLETKRIAFPRFYFVAPADLLDILARGSNPQAVIRHARSYQQSLSHLRMRSLPPMSVPGALAHYTCILTLAYMRNILPPSCRHLPKCFDNIHSLEFAKDAQGSPTKTAVGMYSGEGEYVPFAAPCTCDGPVEVSLGKRGCMAGICCSRHITACKPRRQLSALNYASLTVRHLPAASPHQVWLQNVVDAMRAALSAEFKAIIPTYDERPRTKWIFENSVQNTIVVSRLFFTQEVRLWRP